MEYKSFEYYIIFKAKKNLLKTDNRLVVQE